MVYQGYMLIVLVQMLDGRVPGDKIDDEVYDDEDSTNSKMWQGSLPHKNIGIGTLSNCIEQVSRFFDL